MASPTVFIAGSFVYPSPVFIEMDATVEIAHNFKSQITKHPVESGSKITDHVRPENASFSVKGYVSNHHVAPVVQGNVLGDNGKRTKIAYDYLRNMQKNSVPFTMVTELDSYPNCVIEDLNIPVTAKNGEAIEINLRIEQLRVVSPEFLNTGIVAEKAGDSEGTANGGTASTSSTGGVLLSTPRLFGYDNVFVDPLGD